MPVNFYRVLNIDLAQPASFDLTDKKLIEYLRDKFKLILVFDEAGVCVQHIPVNIMEKAVEEVGMLAGVKTYIQKDIEYAKDAHKEYIQYIVVGE